MSQIIGNTNTVSNRVFLAGTKKQHAFYNIQYSTVYGLAEIRFW